MKNVAVIFGGRSSEREVSKLSAATIIGALPPEHINVLPIYITEDGDWLFYDGSPDRAVGIAWDKLGTPVTLDCGRRGGGLLRIAGEKTRPIKVDVIFPALHGKNGEDGVLQGVFETAGIPYVGCGVRSSAVCMDKAFTKAIIAREGVKQAAYLSFRERELTDDKLDANLKLIKEKIGYPCYVKPSSGGSSIGISRAATKSSLAKAINAALDYDDKIVVEKEIKGREFECAVLSRGDSLIVSAVGEVLSATKFYDYSAKYENSASRTQIPADLPEEVSEKMRETAALIFNALDCGGLSRVDFFYDGELYFNEINTMPGFTVISMYPLLLAHAGVTTEELLLSLIDDAERRFANG
ncbi:D-alanine--D-alanine ligase [Clostridia bacterium]|nr:D-alanine--D-alanine ligase [Clostridia bacterium]